MKNIEIKKLAEYLCAVHPGLDESGYLQQLNMLYGAAFIFEQKESFIYDDIIYIEEERIRRYGDAVCRKISDPVTLLMEYSQISFYLAQRSAMEDRTFKVAGILSEIFSGFYDSEILTDSEKKKFKAVISETDLDFRFAAGNHAVSSIRMAPIIRVLR